MVRIAALFTFSFSLFTLSSCSEDDLGGEPGKGNNGNGGDIRFEIGFAGQTSEGGPQTRAATLSDFTSKFENGDEIGVFAVANGNPLTASGNPIHNVKLTYTETTPGDPGTGSWSLDNGVELWWPGSGGKLDFYAYYPYDDNGGSPQTLDPQNIAFNIATDQSAATDHNKSDLLTAKTANKGKADGAVSLTFSHALAMVQVSIPGGKGWAGGSEGLTVTLRGVKAKSTLDLSAADGTPGSGITVPTTNNDPTAIKMYRLAEPTGGNYIYRALVPAQDVAANNSLFLFDHEGRTLLRDGALSQAVTMTAGKAEKFTRTMPGNMIETVEIPAAGQTFSMGETGYATPVHDVTLTKNFRMSKYVVTNTQYAAFLNTKGVANDGKGTVSYTNTSGALQTNQTQTFISSNSWGVTYANGVWVAQSGYENHPVTNVTWYGAKAYADWIGGVLPTEAQWEYACRGGKTTAFYFGDNDTDMGNYGWSRENNTPSGTKAVGQKLPNAYGLYDMHGNVWEWCGDWYAVYTTSPATDPDVQSTTGYSRVLRGGGWYRLAQYCRSAYRYFNDPGDAGNRFGFRVAVPVP